MKKKYDLNLRDDEYAQLFIIFFSYKNQNRIKEIIKTSKSYQLRNFIEYQQQLEKDITNSLKKKQTIRIFKQLLLMFKCRPV